MKRRTNAPSDGPHRGTSRRSLIRPVRRERALEWRQPAIDWLVSDPVFQARVAART